MYQLTTTAAIVRLADGALIPADPLNTDYAEYLEWAKVDGNTAEPAPAAPVISDVPASVTPRQARLALLLAGHLQAVEDAINALPADQSQAARIGWDYASSVERASPLVATLGAALSLSGAQLDALFVTAGGL